MTRTTLAALGLAALAAAGDARAQMDHSAHGGHAAAMHAPGSAAPYAAEWAAAMGRMHAEMDIALTGDPDVDFALGMIPHHQGAIDMARIQLAHGTDPEMRALAEAILAAQDEEIARMRAFLAARGL